MFVVMDEFCKEVDKVRDSALASGFGTWSPNKGEVGSSIYEGMNFYGDHSYMIKSLIVKLNRMAFPNAMFFRVTKPGMEPAYVHSDREAGQWTCIVYLSQHEERYGTAFYRHRATKMNKMPSFNQLRAVPETFEQLKHDMTHPSPEVWEQEHFIKGEYNRGIIFDATLFHSRYPYEGLGSTDDTARMVWVCHYMTEI